MIVPRPNSPSTFPTQPRGKRVRQSERDETTSACAAFTHARVVRLQCLQKKWTLELEALVPVRPDLAFHLAQALEDLATMIRHVKQQQPDTPSESPTRAARGVAADRKSADIRGDQPLPGDLVIRPRDDDSGLLTAHVFVITLWPDADSVVGGPYQSFGYALRQARELLKDPSDHIWRDHADATKPEQLEEVSADR